MFSVRETNLNNQNKQFDHLHNKTMTKFLMQQCQRFRTDTFEMSNRLVFFNFQSRIWLNVTMSRIKNFIWSEFTKIQFGYWNDKFDLAKSSWKNSMSNFTSYWSLYKENNMSFRKINNWKSNVNLYFGLLWLKMI